MHAYHLFFKNYKYVYIFIPPPFLTANNEVYFPHLHTDATKV